jgi:Rieske [2Fe-2S] domain
VSPQRRSANQVSPNSFGAYGFLLTGSVSAHATGVALRAAAWKASSGEMVPMDGSWQAVAASSDVVADGVMHPFEHGSLIGFVPRADGQPEAVSGICTHQGCRLCSTHRATGCAARAIRPRSCPPVSCWPISCRSTDTAAPVTGS